MQATPRNATWLLLVPCVVLLGIGEIPANPLPKEPDRKVCQEMKDDDGPGWHTSPDCLNESDIAPCEAELIKSRALRIEVRKLYIKDDEDKIVNIRLALSQPPFTPQYNAKDVKTGIKAVKESLAVLKSGDEERTDAVIGTVDCGQHLEAAIAGNNESSSKSDRDRFPKGNTSCSDGDSPCYGFDFYDNEHPNERLLLELSFETYTPPTSFEGPN